MRQRRRVIRAAIALTILVVAGCTQGLASPAPASRVQPTASDSPLSGSAAATATPDAIAKATLSSRTCEFAAARTPPAGSGFSISVVNETDGDSGFDLYVLHRDASYADWIDYNATAQKSFDEGGEGPGDPISIADPIDLMEAVAPRSSGLLVVSRADPGVYVLQCWQFPANGKTRLFSAGPIAVKE
jgi:hypothetical protein